MSVFASGQKTAANPSIFQSGVPTNTLWQGYSFGAQAISDLVVGGPAFYVDRLGPDTTVQATVTAAQKFAGVVMRSNASPMPFADSVLGWSATIPLGTEAQILTRASVPVPVASANEAGSVPLVGSMLYAIDDGTFQTQTVAGAAPATSQATNFRVKTVPAGWTAGAIVEVTNIQNVGA